MRVPIRKPGKYTHLKQDPHITKEKYNDLKTRLEKLTKIVRPRAAAEVRRLALMGDFSENAAYQIAKGKLRGINQRILDIEDLIRRAEIIKPDKNKDTVQVGSFVTIDDGEKIKTYQILGSSETAPSKGIISHNSPLGAPLIGRRIGETVEIKLTNKTVNYKIVEIKN